MARTGEMDMGGDTGPDNVVSLGPGTASWRELLCVCVGGARWWRRVTGRKQGRGCQRGDVQREGNEGAGNRGREASAAPQRGAAGARAAAHRPGRAEAGRAAGRAAVWGRGKEGEEVIAPGDPGTQGHRGGL